MEAIFVPPKAVPESFGIPGPLTKKANPSLNMLAHSNSFSYSSEAKIKRKFTSVTRGTNVN